MDTRKVATEYRLSKWMSVIQEQQCSGQNIKDFCLDKGISRHAYFYWRVYLLPPRANRGLVPYNRAPAWVRLTPHSSRLTPHFPEHIYVFRKSPVYYWWYQERIISDRRPVLVSDLVDIPSPLPLFLHT